MPPKMPEQIRKTLINLELYPAQQANLQAEIQSLRSEVINQANRKKAPRGGHYCQRAWLGWPAHPVSLGF